MVSVTICIQIFRIFSYLKELKCKCVYESGNDMVRGERNVSLSLSMRRIPKQGREPVRKVWKDTEDPEVRSKYLNN